MWGLIAKLLIGLAASVIFAALSYRKPTQTISAEDDIEFPRAEEGSEIGKVFGTVWIESPAVAWHGDLATSAIVVLGARRFGIVGPRERTVVGYKYSLGVHFVNCLGPVDKLLEIKVEEKRAWRGGAAGLAPSGDTITITKPSLFGGDNREGGISGSLNFLSGYETQSRNSYLQGVLGADIPAFRGVASVVLRRMYLGTSAYLKPWRFKTQRVFIGDGGTAQWTPVKAGLSRGIAVRNAAIYIAYDRSGSMAGTRATGQRDALKGFLAALAESEDGEEPNDIFLVGFGSSAGDSISIQNVTAAQYGELSAWLDTNYDASLGGTNYEAALSLAAGFFAGVGGKERVIIFVTDGQPTEGSLEGAVATVAATEASCYCFNIDLGDITATGQLDNTPEDGVPVVTGGDPSSLINAFSQAFSLGYDMNPAHILREVLIARDTNGSGDAAEIGPSFATAADALFAEGFGLSLFWRNTMDKAGFISEVERHIDGRVYQDRRTGLWELKLIRADYDAATLPLFDRTNVVEWGEDISWPDPANLPNQVTVVYTDWKKDEPGSITLTNPARVQAIGKVINTKFDYPGITLSTIAGRVAQRELTASSAPLVSGTIRARYVDPSLNLGSAIKLNNARLGINNLVVRIVELVDGDGRDNSVTIKFIEDRFSLPTTDLVVVENINRPVTGQTLPATLRMVEEAPYWFVATEAGQDDLDTQLAATPGLGWVIATGDQPTGDSIGFQLHTDSGAGYAQQDGQFVFCPASTLRSNLTDRADYVKLLVDSADLANVTVGTLARIGSEYVRIDAIEAGTWVAGDYWEPPVTPTTAVSLLTVGRGCLDTSPQAADAGAVVYFWQGYIDAANVAFADAQTVNVKMLTETMSGVLPIASAPADSVVMASRAIRPYPPGKVQVGASYAPPAEWTGTLALTWAHRSRLLQTSTVFDDHTAASIGPEAGTTYRVKVWPLDINGSIYGSALLDAGGISGTSYSLDTATTAAPAGAWGMRIQVSAERGGYASTRNRSIDVPVLVTPDMLSSATWLDVNDLATAWQDAAGTVAVTTEAQPVGLIENQRSDIL